MLTGKLAKIDLDTGRIDLDPISRATLRNYMGGRGLNMRLLFPWLKKPGDPFDPRSPIVLSPGLMCGIPSLGSRMSISARSPETGYLGDANMGGELGAELKTSGINSFFITGRSSRPVYLWVHDQTVEIRDARKLWGNDPIQTQKNIREELGDNEIKVGCIQCKRMLCMDDAHPDAEAYRSRFIWGKSFTESCPFDALVQWNDDIYHCDLCGGHPQCVTVCSTGAIRLSDKGVTGDE